MYMSMLVALVTFSMSASHVSAILLSIPLKFRINFSVECHSAYEKESTGEHKFML